MYVHLVQGTLFPGVRRPGNDATYSPPTIADIKTEFSYNSAHPLSLHGMKKIPLPFYANEDVKATD